MTDQPASTTLPDRGIEIVRDSTFVRFVADEAVVALVGRDLEVGFLQYGPMFRSQTDHDSFEMTHSEVVVTEVARMRMAYQDFLRMVMSFLQSGIEEGRLKSGTIEKTIAAWGKIANTDNETRVER